MNDLEGLILIVALCISSIVLAWQMSYSGEVLLSELG